MQAREGFIFSPSHTISGCKHVMQKQIIFFSPPLLRIWSKCFRSRTKNVHTSVSLWSQGMPQWVFDTSFHIYLIRWCQKEGNWHFTMAPLLGQTVWPIWQHYFILSKGQTKLKWFFQADVSSKKRMNTFDFTTMIPQVDLFSFVFWKKFKTPKRHFEINWPLQDIF